MPTDTFFHLPKEKQQRLLKAARIEFSRASLADASIANIIKLAEIPRGSFYQYFENKEDLYFYYFDQLRYDTKKEFVKAITAADGDILAGVDTYFAKMIREVLIGEHSEFYRNLFMNMDHRSSKHMTARLELPEQRTCREQKQREKSNALWSFVDQKQLNIKNQEEFGMFMHMLMSLVSMTVTHGYRRLKQDESYSVEQSVTEFRTQLHWLRDGIYRRKEGE